MMADPQTAGRMIRFLAVGAYNTAVGYAIFVALALALGDAWHHQALLAASFAIAVMHSYAMQRWLVFRSSGPMAREFPRFVVVNLSALAINAVLLEVLVRLSVPLLVAQLVATLAVVLVQFVLHQAWSFRPGR